MILDDRIFPRGDKDASQLQEELFLSPQALRGDWLNFTSTEAKAGIVCRYGPPMLRFVGMRSARPRPGSWSASIPTKRGLCPEFAS